MNISFLNLRWTSTSPGKTVFLEKDNSLSLTRDWYASTSSIPSQQILYCILFIVFYYFAFC
ncbi:hypothetical protein RB653_001677 [Dictyostelium firmibasis]|uniref:Uncharacterized protein n=1 Tax=Dictyostelium firmibasis TaxID=79012 RepID=A0AAN7U8R9_9MYCE